MVNFFGYKLEISNKSNKIFKIQFGVYNSIIYLFIIMKFGKKKNRNRTKKVTKQNRKNENSEPIKTRERTGDRELEERERGQEERPRYHRHLRHRRHHRSLPFFASQGLF